MFTCRSCGAEQTDETSKCPHGGTAATNADGSEQHWEFTDMVVPLDLQSNERRLAQRFDERVRDYLRRAAQGGWHPSTPVDWGYMWGAGRVKRSARRPWYAMIGIGRNAFRWESVTIRLKRAAVSELAE